MLTFHTSLLYYILHVRLPTQLVCMVNLHQEAQLHIVVVFAVSMGLFT